MGEVLGTRFEKATQPNLFLSFCVKTNDNMNQQKQNNKALFSLGSADHISAIR